MKINYDPDADIRRMAVWSLANLPDDSGVPFLIDLAKSHSSRAVRTAAIHALAQANDERALEALIAIVRPRRLNGFPPPTFSPCRES